MARIRTRKFREVEEVDIFLAGGLIASGDVVGGVEGNYGVNGLIGKTLKFKQPSVTTVTFVLSVDPNNPNPARLTYKDIKAQIEGAVAGVSAQQLMRHLVLIETTPLHGITIDKTGTANKLLGFDANTDTVGIFYGPISVTAPCLQGAYSTNDNMHVILTLE
jgi:hypothetical protein